MPRDDVVQGSRQRLRKLGALRRGFELHVQLERDRPQPNTGARGRGHHLGDLRLRDRAQRHQVSRARGIRHGGGIRRDFAEYIGSEHVGMRRRDVLLLQHVALLLLGNSKQKAGMSELAHVVVEALARLSQVTGKVGRGDGRARVGEDACAQWVSEEYCGARGLENGFDVVHANNICLDSICCQQLGCSIIRDMRRCLVLCLLMLACSKPEPQIGNVGQPVPAYAAVALGGDSVHVSSLRGDVVLLNVWATWCIPCRKEIPELQALHQQYSARGLRVLGVSVDQPGADADVADFAKAFGMTYPILRDPDETVSMLFAIPGVPASFLVDRAGIVQWRHLGPFKSDDSAFVAVLNSLL
jgi:cytochrome c biogenesis protein CcmG, thiol:disulfide interchange protein DsbE